MFRASTLALLLLSASILTSASPVAPPPKGGAVAKNTKNSAPAKSAPSKTSVSAKDSGPAKNHPGKAAIKGGPAMVGVDESTKTLVSYSSIDKIKKDGDAKGSSSAKDKHPKESSPAKSGSPKASKPAKGSPAKATKPAMVKTPAKAKPAPHKAKRAASNCIALTKEDVKKLPGWKKMEDKAKAAWGKGSYHLATNPEDYPDRPALVCVQEQKSPIAIKGKASCTSSSQTSDGKLVGTEGQVTLTQQDGTSTSSTLTVTTEASFGVGTTMGVEFGVPGLGQAKVETSFHMDVKNSLANAQTSQSSSIKGHDLTVKAPKGKTCHLEYSSTSCTGKGEGSVDYIATGYVWFNFNSKTHGHYKWALKIEDALPNIADRSSKLKFSAAVKSVTNTKWNGKCT